MDRRPHEGGWALLIVLAALAIVAFLSRDAIVQWFGGATRTASSVKGAPPAAGAEQATPAPATPVQRAREVEGTVQKQADDLRQRIDSQAR
jgi:hypothetical protein